MVIKIVGIIYLNDFLINIIKLIENIKDMTGIKNRIMNMLLKYP